MKKGVGEEVFKKHADAGPWAIGSYSSSTIHVVLKADMAGLRKLP